MASEDENEYVTFGTRLERAEEVSSGKRKRQALDEGRLRVGTFSQEVFDENGRRRFHGAFTGGFSAGYYNTVGSKEGWVPQSFTSSRKNRAELAKQRAYDYMDDEEKAEQDSTRLSTASDFDTFGFTAADFARKEAEQELKKRPSAIPGFVPDEIIIPVSRSIGYELLRKMGWRHGRAIGPKYMAASSDAQREGRKAMLAFAPCDQGRPSREEENADLPYSESDAEVLPRSTPIYVINPKKDRHGYGFDPYKNAPEFRERHNRKELFDETMIAKKHHNAASKASLFRPNVGRMGSGFGIGALEELEEEDEDVYAPGVEIESVMSDDESHEPSFKSLPQAVTTETRPGVLPGFKPASQSGSKIELFPSPVVPPDFDGKHQFKDSLESERVCLSYEPPAVAPPDDVHLKKLIEGLATFVARSGQKLENLYMEKRNSNPLFEFLSEGHGHDYYKRRLWEEQRKDSREQAQDNKKEAALNSEQRGQLLGETALRRPSVVAAEDRARLQSALSSAFTKSALKVEDSSLDSQPFSSDPLKQARFEQYLKDKYQGGLRNVQATAKNSLTEWERAQETLEFEAACQNLQKEGGSLSSATAPSGLYQKELQAIMNERFALQSADKNAASESQKEATQKYPMREEQPWRPRPLLCKRFNLLDPYAGKPPPLPKPRSRTESFILLSNPTPSIAIPSIIAENQRSLDSGVNSAGLSRSSEQDTRSPADEGLSIEEQARNIVEKPVDLYKAIFSDDSDEESVEKQEPRAENRSAEAAQAALNRLEAGDFLASIGKELGLTVPPSEFNQTRRVQETFNPQEANDVLAGASGGTQITKGTPQKLQYSELASISSKHIVDMLKGRDEVTEEAGLYLDYSKLELDAEHFDVFSRISSKHSSKKSVFQDIPSQNASNSGNKRRPFSSKGQASSEESVSEDTSDDSETNRRSRNRKKRDKQHSKSEKRKSERDRKRKKAAQYTSTASPRADNHHQCQSARHRLYLHHGQLHYLQLQLRQTEHFASHSHLNIEH